MSQDTENSSEESSNELETVEDYVEAADTIMRAYDWDSDLDPIVREHKLVLEMTDAWAFCDQMDDDVYIGEVADATSKLEETVDELLAEHHADLNNIKQIW